MRRPALLVVLVCLLGAVVGAAPAGAANASVTVSNVSVTPDTAVTGETIRIEPTVRNLASSADPVEIEAVALRTRGGRLEEFDRIRNLGTLSPGAEIPVPLTASFDEPGTRRLELTVYGDDDDGDGILVEYPVTLTVVEESPRVSVDVGPATAGAETTATVTVANGIDRDLRNLQLRLTGVATDEPRRRVLSALPAGETRTFRFNVTPAAAGSGETTARLRYRLAGGPRRTATASTTVDVDARRERVTLNATVAQNRSGDRELRVSAANVGNVPVERLVVRGRASNGTVGQAVVERLPPGSTRSVALPVSDLDGTATVELRGVYEVGGATNRTTGETVVVRANPGRVALTGVDSDPEGGHLRITGSASNVGLEPVDSVVVSVVPTEGVDPTPPNREYFVGTVPASDFVSFDVTARVEPDVTRVPLEVTYLSGGVERATTVEVPIEPAVGADGSGGGSADGGGSGGSGSDGAAGGGDSGGLGGLLLPVVGGLVVLLVVVGFVAIAWRNRRDDS
jgi:uncharacterized membrane protein YgcG